MFQSNSPALADKSKPVVLALGSGSLLSMAASVALLRIVEQRGLAGRIRQVWGCSAGAIVGSLYALGMSPDDIYDHIARLHRRQLVDYNWTGFLSALFTGKIQGGEARRSLPIKAPLRNLEAADPQDGRRFGDDRHPNGR